MLTFFKTIAAVAAMVSIIPLSVWAGSGSWRHGLKALKEYLVAMSVIVVPAVVIAGIGWLWYFIS